MAKDKIKLTEEEKLWCENLQWYVKHKMLWLGPDDLNYFKEAVAGGGKYAVFSMHGDTREAADQGPMFRRHPQRDELVFQWDYFDHITGASTLDGACVIERYNTQSVCRIVHLGMLWVEREVRKLHKPYFATIVEKWNHDAELKRYKELKESLKPVLKYFKG